MRLVVTEKVVALAAERQNYYGALANPMARAFIKADYAVNCRYFGVDAIGFDASNIETLTLRWHYLQRLLLLKTHANSAVCKSDNFSDAVGVKLPKLATPCNQYWIHD